MQSLDNFKIGCTSLGIIMGSQKKTELTELQVGELERLQNKFEPLTKLQDEKLKKLIEKRDGLTPKALSVKAQRHLISKYSTFKYGKRYKIRTAEELRFSSLLKGKLVEASAAKLLSEIDEMEYFAVKSRVSNDYLQGYLDILDAPTVDAASRIIEIKNCFDLESLMLVSDKELPTTYFYQLQGYMAITGKDVAELCYCLCDFPDFMIEEQRSIVFKAMCPDGEPTPAFEKYWRFAEASMRFSDIPPKARIISHIVHRDEETIDKIHKMVLFCRKWLKEWSQKYESNIQRRYAPQDEIRI